MLHFLAGKRLARGRLTVDDATNVQPEARKPLVGLARQYHCLPVAIVFDFPEEHLPRAEPRPRSDRDFGPHVIHRQTASRRSLPAPVVEGRSSGKASGTSSSSDSPEEVEAATSSDEPLWNDRRDEHGPFDIIGDLHGCCDELEALLAQLGYAVDRRTRSPAGRHRHASGRAERRSSLAIWCDRGPRIARHAALAFATWSPTAGACACRATTT